MRSFGLVLGPLLGAFALLFPGARARATSILVSVAVFVAVLSILEAILPSASTHLAGYIRLDATSRLFLAIVDPIFLGVSVYAHFRVVSEPSLQPGIYRFAALSLAFLAATNAVLVANHLFVMWIALEATTFAMAPLVIRASSAPSHVASFRYLLFSTVGLALVLLGFICLTRGFEASGVDAQFFLDQLETASAATKNAWGALGLSLIILGLGTKLGLAPMYSWLPEVYSEAPPAVTALLGAVQFNAALVMLLRVVHSFRPAHVALFSSQLLAMGIVSMVVSTISIIATRNMKRLVAYASINHAGVIAIGLGLGKGAAYGLLLYVISNAFVKAILFLTTGKIKSHYGTEDTREIAGLLKDLPYSGVFLMVGTFALLGFPPFGSFLGELLILSALVGSGHMFVFATFCVLITMTFVATGKTIFPMIWGEPKKHRTWARQTFLSAAPKMFFLAVLVALGVYIPPVVNHLIQEVATSVDGL